MLLRAQLGRTPLIEAAFWGFGAVVQELMNANADVNAADKVISISPPHSVATSPIRLKS